MKKSRNDTVKMAVTSYLERRNYPDADTAYSSSNLSQTAEDMAVTSMVQSEASRTNSILFSCINSDPVQCDVQYSKFVNFIKALKSDKLKKELYGLLPPLLCHLYLEILRGGHNTVAQVFLKRHASTLSQIDMSYHQPFDGNLPSALYRPNSLELLFNSLQNGTIDNDAPEKDFINQILDEIGSVYTLHEVELKPAIAAFRSCKFGVPLSQETLNILKSYLAKQGHVLMMQVLQTWFHFDVDSDLSNKHVDEEDTNTIDDLFSLNVNSEDNIINDINDAILKCNGHADHQSIDTELKELQDSIRDVRESMTPLKLYKIFCPDTHLICGSTDSDCNMLCGGFSNSEVRVWDLGQNNIKRKQAKNICQINIACPTFQDCDEVPEGISIGTGSVLLGHSGPVHAVKVLHKEELILSASQDCTLRAWRISDFSCAAVYRGHNYPIWCMDISKKGLLIVTGSQDKTAKLWLFDRTFPIRMFVGHTSDVTCVKFHPNEAYLATGGADRSVRLWAVCDARLVRVLQAHRGPVRALAFSPSGSCLASAGDDKKIKVWDLAIGTCIHEYRGHLGKVVAMDWSSLANKNFIDTGPDNELLCSAGMDAVVKLWDNHLKTKETTNQDVYTTTYNTKCSYLVDLQVHPNWVVAVGALDDNGPTNLVQD